MGRIALLIIRYGWIARRAERFIAIHEERMKRYRETDWTGGRPSALMAEIKGLRALHGETQWYMWLTAVSMTARKRMLSKFVKRHAPGTEPVSLLAGYGGLKSLEPNRELGRIATDMMSIDAGLAAVLEDGDDATMRARLEGTPGGKDVIDAFDRFMFRYGHLSTSGTDFTVSPWAENPDVIWRSIGKMAIEPEKEGVRDVSAEREKARSEVTGRLNWLRRIYFDRLLAGTVTYLKLRERASFLMSEDAYQMRRLYLALGEDLVASGDLVKPDDIFFLEFAELEELLAKALDSAIARERIKAREAMMEIDARIDLDDVICGEGEFLTPLSPPEGLTHLDGITGSAGVARGYARIVRDPSRAGSDLSKEHVLVVPFMDIGWTPLFSAIGGIVAETGGQLSHSAIVAREYGLPAVVSVKGATRILKDGHPVTVDGNRGRVYLGHVQESGD
jgi:pyruvate,water dikinase